MKKRFIFVSPLLLLEPLPTRDPAAAIEDDVPSLSGVEEVLRKRMCENSTRVFNFSEGILGMGGLSPFYPTRPKFSFDGADVRGVSFVVEGVENQEMGVVLGGETPNVEGSDVEVIPGDGTPSPKGLPPKSRRVLKILPRLKT
ncbi:hypothetical protein HanPI659440_Chr07g0261141 [Helianthus annuus]|nr:hypothetical protein HanPI659440_Chr07g0261141 [Helianthus annuus]